ncbi:arsenate reductase family protein [Paenibacillus sp. alder61]|uniref:arsenate reductase family protein n=1 Tax=Paenibacillus sp. alder61 TaxID=2862948 RepID=UPI001CD25E03|nr:arsenate reductase family protein [Paenibacillus sp. alder61]MCA1295738.1 arsenate reductase family protein [Paenibacillus sp. alder61]
MKKLKVYQYPPCGTCRKAVKWLEGQGYTLDSRNIKETPPNVEELEEMISLSGLELKKFFNTSGDVYREMGLKDRLPAMSREEQLVLLASNGMLIKRPLVTDGKQATVGFKEDMFEKAWG